MAAENAHPLPADSVRAIQTIRDDREHGASWLARAAAQTLHRLIGARDDLPPEAWEATLLAAAQALVAARPSMAAVANTAVRIWDVGRGGSAAERRAAAYALSARLARQDERTRQLLVTHAEQCVTGDVYTMSRSGTVEDVLRALAERKAIGRVIVAESRPGGEGTAMGRALAASGVAVTVVADAACGDMIGEAACVVLGADSLRADGSLVNKVGSYPLALVAREAGKPVYTLCETLKIAAPDFPLVLEEMDPAEIVSSADTCLSARNPYFDVTPARLIAAYITEEGLLDRDAIARHAQEAGAALARLRAAHGA